MRAVSGPGKTDFSLPFAREEEAVLRRIAEMLSLTSVTVTMTISVSTLSSMAKSESRFGMLATVAFGLFRSVYGVSYP